MSRRYSVIAAIVAVCTSGCSFVMTNNPRLPPNEPACKKSFRPIVLDAAGAIVWPVAVAGTFVVVRDDDTLDGTNAAIGAAVVVGVVLAAEIAAAVIGVQRVAKCRVAHAVHDRMKR